MTNAIQISALARARGTQHSMLHGGAHARNAKARAHWLGGERRRAFRLAEWSARRDAAMNGESRARSSNRGGCARSIVDSARTTVPLCRRASARYRVPLSRQRAERSDCVSSTGLLPSRLPASLSRRVVAFSFSFHSRPRPGSFSFAAADTRGRRRAGNATPRERGRAAACATERQARARACSRVRRVHR